MQGKILNQSELVETVLTDDYKWFVFVVGCLLGSIPKRCTSCHQPTTLLEWPSVITRSPGIFQVFFKTVCLRLFAGQQSSMLHKLAIVMTIVSSSPCVYFLSSSLHCWAIYQVASVSSLLTLYHQPEYESRKPSSIINTVLSKDTPCRTRNLPNAIISPSCSIFDLCTKTPPLLFLPSLLPCWFLDKQCTKFLKMEHIPRQLPFSTTNKLGFARGQRTVKKVEELYFPSHFLPFPPFSSLLFPITSPSP